MAELKVGHEILTLGRVVRPSPISMAGPLLPFEAFKLSVGHFFQKRRCPQAGRFKSTSIYMHAGCIKRSYGVVFSVLWIRQMDTGPGSRGSLPQC